MPDEPQEDPAKKLRKLLGTPSPMARLPKKKPGDVSFLSDVEKDEKEKNAVPEHGATVRSTVVKLPPAPPPKPKPASVTKSGRSFFGPAFWTTASILSLTVNLVLLLVLVVLAIGLRRYGLSVSSMLNMGNGLLGGLHENFEKMDRARIQTNVEVNTTIPVRFDLQLNQQTDVILSQDVTITNALVTVNTGGLNISRANTTIVLPQGTRLPILLNLTVPVDTTVPVILNVPVDIPLAETELHEPFTGLQDVIRPFYCMINPNALNLDGERICR
jgi:hypothetical protein